MTLKIECIPVGDDGETASLEINEVDWHTSPGGFRYVSFESNEAGTDWLLDHRQVQITVSIILIDNGVEIHLMWMLLSPEGTSWCESMEDGCPHEADHDNCEGCPGLGWEWAADVMDMRPVGPSLIEAMYDLRERLISAEEASGLPNLFATHPDAILLASAPWKLKDGIFFPKPMRLNGHPVMACLFRDIDQCEPID